MNRRLAVVMAAVAVLAVLLACGGNSGGVVGKWKISAGEFPRGDYTYGTHTASWSAGTIEFKADGTYQCALHGAMSRNNLYEDNGTYSYIDGQLLDMVKHKLVITSVSDNVLQATGTINCYEAPQKNVTLTLQRVSEENR